VTLSIANHTASLPIAYRLYLPEASANLITHKCQPALGANMAWVRS